MKKLLIAVGFAGLLSACQNMSDPTTAIVSAETAYAGAVSGEIVYLNSGKADPAIVKQIEGYRMNAHNVLAPLAKAAASGTPPTSDQALAAQTAVNVLTEFMTVNHISTGSN